MKFVNLCSLAIAGISSLSLSAMADSHRVVCTADGPTVSQAGGELLRAEADLTFYLMPLRDGQMRLSELTGTIKIAGPGEEVSEDDVLDKTNSYIGEFNFDHHAYSNRNYRPRKYKNFVQFNGIDALQTTGLEKGMWGQLLVQKTRSSRLAAKYIFKAGDHLGGTLHLECQRD